MPRVRDTDICVVFTRMVIRDRPINRTYRLIGHSTSDFDDRLQFYKIDYFDVLKKKIVSRNSLLFK